MREISFFLRKRFFCSLEFREGETTAAAEEGVGACFALELVELVALARSDAEDLVFLS